jgi:hypothetical protein
MIPANPEYILKYQDTFRAYPHKFPGNKKFAQKYPANFHQSAEKVQSLLRFPQKGV